MASQTILELWPSSSLEEVQTIIRAVYKQVLGNPHVMESERLVTAESQLCDRSITVREFVRSVAKSDFYRNRYFQSCAPYRFVELNFLHLLGRAPQDQREVSEHIVRTVAEGYDAEIDSYIDSSEYEAAFGENVVPYYRGRSSEANSKQVGFNRIFALDRGPAQIDSAVKSAQLVYAVATNSANAIKASSSTVIGSGTEKRFKILVQGSKFDSPRRISTTEYIVPASKMTPQIQRINRTSGKIVSITEIV
ncbi:MULTISPECIES: phycobilisome rod-core linker polypeptide [unclassified Tolypothrix]|uniref:Phycobilisome 27.9 kDa linker polypeptide, phycoerythrin-associated, rod n=2 Tax=Nostocales TaxID=1161 RepID=PYR2_MICDP|nr:MULTISPECIES: phycobilisome rod-core linker polypeptide [unclassified Tolypothrix]P18543.3 RecName: Full=Phycobilisome 27.9 kDa linker polypeptide, phycoerythrin-associated, rod [Microchaete diplosiphon]ABP99027.1 CpeD [Fremyella diplosiphon Fd33]BAY90159.1 phycobilisome linker polypeptide [Microchaete diplosiphon NIES-3275]AAA24883.1 phycoerythrin-associated linker protein [Tolypothrix sp. PCC 7601]EKF01400.1 phycoerythrocyanin-associated protein [Tolypothrix sp. PCC 7601]MBE9083576.1 phy